MEKEGQVEETAESCFSIYLRETGHNLQSRPIGRGWMSPMRTAIEPSRAFPCANLLDDNSPSITDTILPT